MSSFSDYLENALIDATLRSTSFTSPSAVYAALHVSAPTDADSGIEVIGGGYSRQAVSFKPPVNGNTSNNGPVIFGMATTSWGTITHFGIYDASTAGNLLYWGALGQVKVVDNGDFFTAPDGLLTISLK